MKSVKFLLISFFTICIGAILGIDFRGQGILDAFMDFNLMEMIPVPPENGVEFITGSDGFVAYQFKTGADVKFPYRLVLPEKLNEFAIMATFRPNSRTGGYLFSIVNPLDTVVQLGIHISPADRRDKWNITLLYTDASIHMATKKLVTFEIDYSKRWQKIAFEVLSNKLTFFYDCVEVEMRLVKREPPELVFDSASTLYLAQGGSMLKGHFEVCKF
ncbi:collagen alpha-1(XV) chain-like [Condylostylus longicornis]|uniref:collagen alpha-1(XV) chain-like n=1 Tax=Condylostylus longicornis TaxID=2530218 RepID=UPI00244DC0FE|nr:collagen alpha-1(XV) chain-like [Condylostylus longicornis]